MKKLRRLRRLKLRRVDLVPRGANKDAHIKLFKQETKTVDGVEYPRSDWAYTPDGPSSWKLRLTSEPGGKPDARIVGAAVAALGEGFRGQKVQIPSANLSAVKRKVLAAWLKANPEKERGDAPEVLKMAEENKSEEKNSEEKTGASESTEGKTAEEFEAEVKDLQEEKAEADKELEEARKKLEETPAAELEKAQEEVKKLKTELSDSKEADVRKELDETKTELAVICKERRTEKFVTKAKAYKDLGSPEDIAKLLMAADEHFADEEKEMLDKFFKAANKQIEEGALFERLSKDVGDGPQEWEDKLDQAARDRVAKGDAATVEIAKTEIMREDPELRKEREASLRS